MNLKGEHFDLKVQRGQEVRAGDVLLEFDIDAVREAGYPVITPVIVTNTAKHPVLGEPATGPVAPGYQMLYFGAV